jgi:hypothetical protein
MDLSQQHDLNNLYADLSLNSHTSRRNGILGNIIGNLGGEILSQFRYETSMNQSKLLFGS